MRTFRISIANTDLAVQNLAAHRPENLQRGIPRHMCKQPSGNASRAFLHACLNYTTLSTVQRLERDISLDNVEGLNIL